MDCPKCGTWNPDDKDLCWRCQTPMPTPVEKKPRKRLVLWGLPLWAWILVLLLFFSPMLSQCFFAPV